MPLSAKSQAALSAALPIVMEFEGLRTAAYADPATGGEPWTIGYGHTSSAGAPKVMQGLKITKAEAEAILARDLEAVVAAVTKAVTRDLTANQLAALISFTFNLGAGALRKSTLLKKANAGDFHGAASEFLKWDKAAGKKMPGLTRRRIAEAKLFSTP